MKSRLFDVEIPFLIAVILLEIDPHLCFHDSQAASDNTFVINLFDQESKSRIKLIKFFAC